MTSHLFGLNDIFQYFFHCCSLSRSSCRICLSCIVCMFLYKRVSSAKSREMESTFCGMSFMYSKDKRGPRTLPCGTPDVTGAGPDVCPSTSTRWLLLARKLLIHMMMLPLMPQCCKLIASSWWDTLSNALLKSSSAKSICSPWSNAVAKSCSVMISWLSHDLLFLKLCCWSERILCVCLDIA